MTSNKKMIAGNWKMNGSLEANYALERAVVAGMVELARNAGQRLGVAGGRGERRARAGEPQPAQPTRARDQRERAERRLVEVPAVSALRGR